jgi:DNA-binding transcriptional ArsR family regulator
MIERQNGWIKIHRKMEDNDIFKDPKNALLLRTFMWLLWNANRFKKGELNMSELLATYEEMASILDISVSTLTRHLKELEDMELIFRYHYKLNTRILIKNYEKYQSI